MNTHESNRSDADPTDPEVPNAKRRRELRRRRSFVMLGGVVAVLLSAALLLIYKTGRQVTTVDPREPQRGSPRGDRQAERLRPLRPAVSEERVASTPGRPVLAPSTAERRPGRPAPSASTDLFRRPGF